MSDADDAAMEQLFVTSEGHMVSGAVKALEAVGIEYDVSCLFVVEAATGPTHDREDSLQDLTELAGETEDRGGQDMLDSDPVTFDEHADRRDNADEYTVDLDDLEPVTDDEGKSRGGSGDDSDTTDSGEGSTDGDSGNGSGSDDGREQTESDESDAEGRGDSGNGRPPSDSSPEKSSDTGSPNDADDGGESGNSTGGRSTTDTISGANPTGASSTTKQFGANENAITNLDASGAAGDVYGALANTNRVWATSEELPIANVDVESQGYTSVSDVLASLWKGDILERRELDERRGRCLYEYRIAPEGDDG